MFQAKFLQTDQCFAEQLVLHRAAPHVLAIKTVFTFEFNEKMQILFHQNSFLVK